MSDIKKAIILVAGYGTRFLPITKGVPKEMLPLVDKPIVHYLVDEIHDAGIREVIFVTSKSKRAVEDYFDRAPELEAFLREKGKEDLARVVEGISSLITVSSVRQKEQRGIADAILSARHLLGDEPFAVMSGDDVIEAAPSALSQMISIYKEYRAPVTCLIRVPAKESHKYGIIEGTEVAPRVWKIARAVEKPAPGTAPTDLATLTRFIITPDFLPYLERVAPVHGEVYVPPAIEEYVKAGGTFYGYEVEGEYYDCGSKLGYLRAVVEMGCKHPEIGEQFRAYLTEAYPRLHR